MDRNPMIAGAKVLFISPHPDDIPLSLGGTAAPLASEGQPCLQVRVFSDAPPEPRTLSPLVREIHRLWGFGEEDTDRIWQQRHCEDQAACRVLGLGWTHLGYSDALYRGYTSRASLRG